MMPGIQDMLAEVCKRKELDYEVFIKGLKSKGQVCALSLGWWWGCRRRCYSGGSSQPRRPPARTLIAVRTFSGTWKFIKQDARRVRPLGSSGAGVLNQGKLEYAPHAV